MVRYFSRNFQEDAGSNRTVAFSCRVYYYRPCGHLLTVLSNHLKLYSLLEKKGIFQSKIASEMTRTNREEQQVVGEKEQGVPPLASESSSSTSTSSSGSKEPQPPVNSKLIAKKSKKNQRSTSEMILRSHSCYIPYFPFLSLLRIARQS